jgi:hypothetical protein
MTIVDPVSVDERTPEQAPRRSRWATSRVPWIITGGIALAVLVGGLVTFSIRATDNTIDRSRTNAVQSCIDSGGAAADCAALFGRQSAARSADDSALQSIAG